MRERKVLTPLKIALRANKAIKMSLRLISPIHILMEKLRGSDVYREIVMVRALGIKIQAIRSLEEKTNFNSQRHDEGKRVGEKMLEIIDKLKLVGFDDVAGGEDFLLLHEILVLQHPANFYLCDMHDHIIADEAYRKALFFQTRNGDLFLKCLHWTLARLPRSALLSWIQTSTCKQ
jgi:hypothetical protein